MGLSILAAMYETLELADRRGMGKLNLSHSVSYAHLVEMQIAMTAMEDREKANRYLGWAQCAVVAAGLATLDDMTALNRKYQSDHGGGSGPAFQFQLDNRSAGPVRKTWNAAAQDAVSAGYAVWSGCDQIKLDSSQGAAITRL